MDRLPVRNEPMYKDIEKFEDYELTNCIAYEMAIRNEENQKLLEKFIKKFINNIEREEKSILFLNPNYSKWENQYLVDKSLKTKRNSYFPYPLIYTTDNFSDKNHRHYNCFAIELMDNRGISPLNLYLRYPFFKDINSLICKKLQLGEKYQQTVCSVTFFYDDKLSKINKKWETDCCFIEHNYVTTKYFSYDGLYTVIYNPKGDIKNQSLTNMHITPRYQRPKLLSTFKKMRSVLVDINLSLPENELIVYIKKIKNEVKSDTSIIKTPMEL